MIKHSIGFFESDCRQMNVSGTKMIFRSRTKIIGKKVKKLYNIASEMNIPYVITFCCGVKMFEKNMLPDILFIPIDQKDDEWTKYVKDYRQFFIQKLSWPKTDPQGKRCDYFNAFKYNGNAVKLIKMLDVSEWIVFGNSFEFCVNTAIQSLITAGQKVTLLTDTLIRGTKGFGDSGTDEKYNSLINEFRSLGVSMKTLDELKNE
ncbi:MAG: hypothetical protein WC614_03590 [bacterium]